MMPDYETPMVMRKLDPKRPQPTGEIVEAWNEFGEHFEIEKLLKPFRQGASDRYYRLWHNGSPAFGGQWTTDVYAAKQRADYLLRSSYLTRIAWLEQTVQRYQAHGNTLNLTHETIINGLRFAPGEYRLTRIDAVNPNAADF